MCARSAVTAGTDTIFACGGDGTVHDVLQEMVHGPGTLGIVPLGTANALARNLGLSLDPVEAVRQQMNFAPMAIPLGEIRFPARASAGEQEPQRYFLVMAGAGPDGALVYSLLAGSKATLGRIAYYAHAARLFLTRRFPPFRVEYRLPGEDRFREHAAASVMAVRVGDLGGVFSRLAGGASLFDETLQLLVVKPPAILSLPAWFGLSHVGLSARNPWLHVLPVAEFRCSALGPRADRIHAQVDGEWMGELPFNVRLVRDAVRLLMRVALP